MQKVTTSAITNGVESMNIFNTQNYWMFK
jgi:hypothetical protein